MTILLNSLLLNALVATGLALLVWTVAIIPAIRRRPGLRHVMWVVVLLKLVTPPVFEVSILPGPFASETVRQAHPHAIPLNDMARDAPGEPLLVPRATTPLEMPQTDPPMRRIDWMIVLAVVIGLGTLTVLLVSIKQVLRLRAVFARSSNDGRLRLIAQQSAKQMGLSAPPTVCVVAANVSPLLWVRRSGPEVVIPRRLADQMSDEQLSCIVSHEIAHYLRRDHWTNLFSLLVAASCWWNPLVWWVRRELRTAQEACCDALVISRSVASRRRYAETLFQALEFMQAEGSLSPALASSFGAKTSTRRRFEMIANPQVNHRLSWWSYPLLLAVVAVLPCVPVRGQSDEANDSEALEQTQRSIEPVADGEYSGQLNEFYLSLDPGAIEESFELIVDDQWEGQLGLYPLHLNDLLIGRHAHDYRLPDYLPAAHGNAVSAGEGRYYVLTPKGSDRVWYVQYSQDDAEGRILWDATLKLPPEGELKQGDAFVLNTSTGIVTVAVVEDDYDNDRDIGVRQIDVKTGAVKDERTLLRHMARYQSFLEFMQGENDDPKEDRNEYSGAVRRANMKLVGNDLTIELEGEEGANRIQTALELWQRVLGDRPVEQIRTSRADGKVRIIIKGKISRRPNSDHGAKTEKESFEERTYGSAVEMNDSGGYPGSPAAEN